MSKKSKEPKAAEAGRKEFKVALADTPRAIASIRRTKARGGLLAFTLAALGAWMHGSVPVDVVVRGLEGGIAGYLVCWFAAVTAWRAVIRAEARSAIDHALEQRQATLAAMAARASE